MTSASTPLRVGLIGLGAIGLGAVRAATAAGSDDLVFVGALVRDPGRVRRGTHPPTVATLEELIGLDPSVVVECAGPAALRQYGAAVLRAGRDLLVVSAGALADAHVLASMREAARDGGARMWILSGAIGGLDAIAAASLGTVRSVTHTIRKPARTLMGAEVRATEAVELYRGPSGLGIARFPDSANVAAAVSLAGIGFEATQLRVIADPGVTRNEHVIEVSGDFGDFRLEFHGVPTDDNPRTSRLAPLSVARALRDLTATVVVR